jgi:hypothetical protein
VRLSTTGKAVLVPKDIIIPQRIQDTSFGSPENSPEALCDEEDGQSMAQNVVAQSCSNGRLASASTNETMRRRQNRITASTRSSDKIQVKSYCAFELGHFTCGNNAPRDGEERAFHYLILVVHVRNP